MRDSQRKALLDHAESLQPAQGRQHVSWARAPRIHQETQKSECAHCEGHSARYSSDQLNTVLSYREEDALCPDEQGWKDRAVKRRPDPNPLDSKYGRETILEERMARTRCARGMQPAHERKRRIGRSQATRRKVSRGSTRRLRPQDTHLKELFSRPELVMAEHGGENVSHFES